MLILADAYCYHSRYLQAAGTLRLLGGGVTWASHTDRDRLTRVRRSPPLAMLFAFGHSESTFYISNGTKSHRYVLSWRQAGTLSGNAAQGTRAKASVQAPQKEPPSERHIARRRQRVVLQGGLASWEWWLVPSYVPTLRGKT